VCLPRGDKPQKATLAEFLVVLTALLAAWRPRLKDSASRALLAGMEALLVRVDEFRRAPKGTKRLRAYASGAVVGLRLTTRCEEIDSQKPFPNPERDRDLAGAVDDLETIIDHYAMREQGRCCLSEPADTILGAVSEVTGIASAWAKAPPGARIINESRSGLSILRLELPDQNPPPLSTPCNELDRRGMEKLEVLGRQLQAEAQFFRAAGDKESLRKFLCLNFYGRLLIEIVSMAERMPKDHAMMFLPPAKKSNGELMQIASFGLPTKEPAELETEPSTPPRPTLSENHMSQLHALYDLLQDHGQLFETVEYVRILLQERTLCVESAREVIDKRDVRVATECSMQKNGSKSARLPLGLVRPTQNNRSYWVR